MKERQKATEEQVLELTERISALNRENELLDSALHAARTRSEEVSGLFCVFLNLQDVVLLLHAERAGTRGHAGILNIP